MSSTLYLGLIFLGCWSRVYSESKFLYKPKITGIVVWYPLNQSIVIV